MNIEVRYFSRGGNTKKVAQAIAKAVGVNAKDCSEGISEPVDLLFLGGSVYGFGLDDTTKNYIQSLNPAYVKKVALFGTSAILKNGNAEMAKLLIKRGVSVLENGYYCRGEFANMHKGHPNDVDLAKAAEFASEVINSVGGTDNEHL